MKRQSAYEKFAQELRKDPEYREGWKANLAMTIYDGSQHKIGVRKSNKLAELILTALFKV